MKFPSLPSVLLCGAMLAVSSWCIAPNASSAEIYTNEKLLKAVKAKVDLSVILDQINAAGANCHFDSSTDAIIAIQTAGAEGGMNAENIKTLQKRIIEVAGKDQKALTTLVSLAQNIWVNYSPEEEEYQIQMRQLLKEGKAVVPELLKKLIDQSSENPRKKAGNLAALAKLEDRSETVVAQIVPFLEDRDKPVRMQAAKTVAALSNEKTLDGLVARLTNLGGKIDGIVLAVGYMGEPKPQAITALTRVLKSSLDSDARFCAATSLGELRAKSNEALDTLLEAVLDERDEKLRFEASLALAKIGDKRTPSFIRRAVERFRNGGDVLIRNLAYFRDTETIEFLLEHLDNDRIELKKAAFDTLSLISNGEKYDNAEEWRGWWVIAQTQPRFQEANASPKLPDPRSGAEKNKRATDTPIPTNAP